MGSNWWFKFVFTVALIVLAVRSLVPTFGLQKPEQMPVFRVEYELNAAKEVVKEKDGKPKIKYETHTSGKNKGQVVKDENGDPVPVYARDKQGNCIPEWTFTQAHVLDKNGNPTIDPKTKKPQIKTYKTPISIYDRQKNEHPIDARREYVKVPKKDSKGLPITTKRQVTETVVRKVPKLDKNGKPLKDKEGKPILETKTETKQVEKTETVMEVANMTDELWSRCYLPKWYQWIFPYKQKVRLGLDLQGGTHLVMNVDVEKALATKASSLAEDLNRFLLEKKLIVPPKAGEVSRVVEHPSNATYVKITFPEKTDKKHIEQFRQFMSGGQFRDNIKLTQGSKDNEFTLRYDDESIKRSREAALSQAIETIRGRVDSLGVSEPSISQYGDTQIVVQLPGLKNPQRAKELIGKTALLAFHVVEDDHADSQNIFASMSSDTPKGVQSQVQSYNRPAEAKEASGYDRFFYGPDKTALQKWAESWNKKLEEGFSKGTYNRPYTITLGQYDNTQKRKRNRQERIALANLLVVAQSLPHR